MRTAGFSVLALAAFAVADNAANFNRDTAPEGYSSAAVVSQISDGKRKACMSVADCR